MLYSYFLNTGYGNSTLSQILQYLFLSGHAYINVGVLHIFLLHADLAQIKQWFVLSHTITCTIGWHLAWVILSSNLANTSFVSFYLSYVAG